MTINSLSRYTTEVANDGTVVAVRKQYSEIPIQIYIVKPGDTFENLAAKIYGDSSQHWRLLDLNPQIDFTFDLKANDRIRVPL
jgi:nucleoid-associated protein YgaU